MKFAVKATSYALEWTAIVDDLLIIALHPMAG